MLSEVGKISGWISSNGLTYTYGRAAVQISLLALRVDEFTDDDELKRKIEEIIAAVDAQQEDLREKLK